MEQALGAVSGGGSFMERICCRDFLIEKALCGGGFCIVKALCKGISLFETKSSTRWGFENISFTSVFDDFGRIKKNWSIF